MAINETCGPAGAGRSPIQGESQRAMRRSAGFTLMELLVVIATIALLAALLLPSLAAAKDRGKRAACISNLRQIGIAIHGYAHDHDGRIPYGPAAPPFTHPAEFYPSTGSPTSLLSLRQMGAPVALGLMLKDDLAQTPKILFCPGSDQSVDADAELAKVGITQARGSYYYRHGGVTTLWTTPASEPQMTHLESPGMNRMGKPVRALAIDSQFLISGPVAASAAAYGIKSHTHHKQRVANVLFNDGSVRTLNNQSRRYTLEMKSNADLYDAFNRILRALEYADAEY
jgi:prepilin-type N-terminal cleavage/methylation domain-containing protein/prepilin-type processing-associated H-X9-DG protein